MEHNRRVMQPELVQRDDFEIMKLEFMNSKNGQPKNGQSKKVQTKQMKQNPRVKPEPKIILTQEMRRISIG